MSLLSVSAHESLAKLPSESSLHHYARSKSMGLFHVACFLVIARLIERWALGEVLALSAMAGCSQRVELCAAYALRMQGRWDM